MQQFLEEVKKKKKTVEVWLERLDDDDTGVLAGKIIKVYQDGFLLKDTDKKLKEHLSIFIPFSRVLRIML